MNVVFLRVGLPEGNPALLRLIQPLHQFEQDVYKRQTLSNYMLLLIPFSALIGWGYAKLRFLIAQKTQAMLARTTTYLVERTANLALIKTANAQQQEIERGRANFQEQYVMQIKTGLMTSLYTALQTLYNIVSIIIPFSVGAVLVSQGVLTAGVVIAFYSISGSVGVAFTNVINYAGEVRQANGALARVINTMKLPDEQGRNGRDLDQPDEDIQLVDVTFGSVSYTHLMGDGNNGLARKAGENGVAHLRSGLRVQG